jgi:hypothetical protein
LAVIFQTYQRSVPPTEISGAFGVAKLEIETPLLPEASLLYVKPLASEANVPQSRGVVVAILLLCFRGNSTSFLELKASLPSVKESPLRLKISRRGIFVAPSVGHAQPKTRPHTYY